MESVSAAIDSDVTVYLLTENRLLRESLSRMLQKRAGICVAGASRYTHSPLEEILASNSDILLMDSISPPQCPNLLQQLSDGIPEVKAILFGMDEDHETFLKSAALGVCGYVLKEASASEIIMAVRGVARGEAYCPARLCMVLIQHLSSEAKKRAKNGGRDRVSLTHRQLQLVDLVEKGLTNKEIATSLNLSEFTVKNHLRRIMRQVEAGNRHEAVDVIRAEGFLPGM